MERKEKEGEKAAEKKEFLGIKLKQRILVGKRRGPCTPVRTWKMERSKQENIIKASLITLPSTTISSRRLCSNLWEIQQISLSKMNKTGVRVRHHKDTDLADPFHSTPDLPASASSLRRHVAASLMQHYQSIERKSHALQPVSPASSSSSMEMAAYNPAMTPPSSLGFKGRLGETGYNLKTSTELLKVLNRIWNLEEQHVSNRSLVKMLKMELDNARTRIKELVQEKQVDRHEIDDLMKQVTEDQFVRKSKEQDRVKVAVQSVRDELEDERKLRKRSESLHRRLAQELSEVKYSYAKALKDIEKEKKTRALVEDLCDEFAKGIGDYEEKVSAVEKKFEKDQNGKYDHDWFILHASQAWLEERMKIQLAENTGDLAEKNRIMDKLSSEIETFLQLKRVSKKNEDVSEAEDTGDEEDSVSNDSHCFELNKNVGEKKSNGFSRPNVEEAIKDHLREEKKLNRTKKKLGSRERIKSRIPSNLQKQFEEKMAWAMSCNESKIEDEVNLIDSSVTQKYEKYEEDGNLRKSKWDRINGLNSNAEIENLIRSQCLDDGKIYPDIESREESRAHLASRGNASPIQQWVSRFASPASEISESSSKFPQVSKENYLKTKLLEARLKGQHSRLKAFKGPF